MKFLVFNMVFGILLVAGMLGCKKSAPSIPAETYVYLSPGSIAYNTVGTDSVILLESGVTETKRVSFPVSISRAYQNPIQIKAHIDTTLTRMYDSLNNFTTTSPILPAGAFELENGGQVTISSGAMQSADSIKVRIKNASALPPGTNVFIVPVVIEPVVNDIPVSVNRNVMFVKVYTRVMSAGIRDLQGSAITSGTVYKKGSVASAATTAYYFRSFLTDKSSTDRTVSIEVNNNLVANYNAANNTGYEVFPGDAYDLVKSATIISAGSTASKDSFIVQLKNLSSFELNKIYLLPLQIKSVSGTPSLNPIETQKIVYLKISVEETNVDPVNPTITGTTLSRTGWSVTASSSFSATYSASNVLDGSNSTSWLCTGSAIPAYLILNMGSLKSNVIGFSFYPYSNATYLPANMEVYSSTDGLSWNYEGVYSSTATTIAIKYIKFLSSVTAQYFKFNITKANSSTSFTGFAEINGFQ